MNFLINFGSVITYPLFIAVGFSLALPMNLLLDLFMRGTSFSTLQLAGTVVAMFAIVLLLSMDFILSHISPTEQLTRNMLADSNEIDPLNKQSELLNENKQQTT